MRVNEAKAIFAEVLKVDCRVCGKLAKNLCETKNDWVHEQRIDDAEIEDDGYLRIAAVRKITMPSTKPSLGDSYAALQHSAMNFSELFGAFNREITASRFEKNYERGLSVRALYLAVSNAVTALEKDFDDFNDFYEKEVLNDEERAMHEALTKSVHNVKRDLEAFTEELKTSPELESTEDQTFKVFEEGFNSLKREILRFSIDYGTYVHHLIAENLEQTFELFSEAFDDRTVV